MSANGYFSTYDKPAKDTLIRSAAFIAVIDAIIAGFDKLPTPDEMQQDRMCYCTCSGATNVYALVSPFTISSYIEGLRVTFKANAANTGACTINLNTIGAVAIKRQDGSDLIANDIASGAMVVAVHDGTHFQLISSTFADVTAAAASASAAATSATNANNSASSAAASATSAAGSASAAAAISSAFQFSGGNVGIGLSPSNLLDMSKSQDAPTIAKLLNGNAGVAARAIFQLSNSSGHVGNLQFTGANWTPSGLVFADGLQLISTGAGGMSIFTSGSTPVYFGVNGTEVMRVTAGQYLKATSSADYHNAAGTYHELRTNAGNSNAAIISNTDAVNPYGLAIFFTGGAPNDSSRLFMDCEDSSAQRIALRSNGGIANFSANNVNLSDQRTKTPLQRYDDDELDRLEAAFTHVDWGRFKYTDQSHDDWNHGYTAQGVEKAFSEAAPELVDVWNETKQVEIRDDDGQVINHLRVPTLPEERLKAVYATDLGNIGMALLSRALKRIWQLEGIIKANGLHLTGG